MIRVNNSDSLSLLISDIHRVLCEASKEFDVIEYRFDFDLRNKGVKCVRFLFQLRKNYYTRVYPYQVELFRNLDMLARLPFSGLTFVRHSTGSFIDNGVKKYSLVLWY